MYSLALKGGALPPRSGALRAWVGAFGPFTEVRALVIAKIGPGCDGLGSALLGEGLNADKFAAIGLWDVDAWGDVPISLDNLL